MAETKAATRWAGRATALFCKMPMFASLSERELAKLVSLAAPKTIPKGTLVFHEGDTLDCFYVVLEGKLKILRHSPAGKDLTIGVISAGHTVGEEVFFEWGKLYVSLEALEDTTMMVVRNADFKTIVGNNHAVLSCMARVVAHRFKYMQDRLIEMVSCTAEERVINTLRMLARQFGAVIPLMQRDIGEMAGTTRETTTRVISRLQAKGLVSCVRGKIILLKDI